MQEFNEGDLVEAVLGEQAIRGRVAQVVGDPTIHVVAGPLAWDHNIQSLASVGFVFNVIEKATPKLPTEPGLYEDTEGDVWMQDINRDWFCLTSGHRPNVSMPVIESTAASYAPFIRLEPVPVTAKRFAERLNRVRMGTDQSIALDIDQVAAEFGASE